MIAVIANRIATTLDPPGDWHLADRFSVQLHVGTVALLPGQPAPRLNGGGVSETDREIGGQGQGTAGVQFL